MCKYLANETEIFVLTEHNVMKCTNQNISCNKLFSLENQSNLHSTNDNVASKRHGKFSLHLMLNTKYCEKENLQILMKWPFSRVFLPRVLFIVLQYCNSYTNERCVLPYITVFFVNVNVVSCIHVNIIWCTVNRMNTIVFLPHLRHRFW